MKKCVPSVEMDLDDTPDDVEIDLGTQWLRAPKGGISSGNKSRKSEISSAENHKVVPRLVGKKSSKAIKSRPKPR